MWSALTRITKAKAVRGAPKGQQAAFRFNRVDQSLQELPHVFFHCHLLLCREELYHKINEALRELGDEQAATLRVG